MVKNFQYTKQKQQTQFMPEVYKMLRLQDDFKYCTNLEELIDLIDDNITFDEKYQSAYTAWVSTPDYKKETICNELYMEKFGRCFR